MRSGTPIPLMVFGAGLCAVAFSTIHPVIVTAVLIVAILLVTAVPSPPKLVISIAAMLGLGVAVLNPFVQASGDLIIVEFPDVPIFDTQVTLEELAAGAVLGMRAAAVTIIIMSVLLLVDGDRLLALASRLMPRSALAVAIASRLLPTLRRDAQGLVETARLRGHSPSAGGWVTRARAAGPLALPLVGSALDRSLDVAEAMAARGYGSGPRTRQATVPWRLPDRVLFFIGVGFWILTAVLAVGVVPDYAFYPTMDVATRIAPLAFTAALVGGGATARMLLTR